MNMDQIRNEIKSILFFSNDPSQITLEAIEKQIEKANKITNEEMILMRNDIVQYFRKQFQLLRRIECEYFDIKIQTWFDWYTKRRITEENTIQETISLQTIDPKTPFMLFCLQNIQKEVDSNRYESVSDVMKEMQVKWKNIDEETRKRIAFQLPSYRTLHRDSFNNDYCYQRFFSADESVPFNHDSYSINPSLSEQLASLQTLVLIDDSKASLSFSQSLHKETSQESTSFSYLHSENNPFDSKLTDSLYETTTSQTEKRQLDEIRKIVYTTEEHEKKPRRGKKGKKVTRGNRHPTLYNLFFSHRMKEEREKDKSISFVDLSSKLAKEWNEMSEERKSVYCEELKKSL